MSADGTREAVLPWDRDAEMAILGGVMLDNRTFYVASALVREDEFFAGPHRVIWRTIAGLIKAGKSADLVSLHGAMRDAGTLEDAGGIAYLGSLANDTPGSANVGGYAERVKDLAQRRRVIDFAQRLQQTAQTTSGEELMGKATQAVNALLSHATGASKRFVEAVADAEFAMEAAAKRRHAGGTVGAPSGLRSLDHVTGGFVGPRLIVVAARPKCGKSALLNQFGMHAASHGFGGLICTIELGTDELVIRAMANLGAVNVSRLHRGYDEERAQGVTAALGAGDIPLWIDSETSGLEQICAQIAMHRHRYGIQWAAVDHIGLVHTEKKFGSRNDQIGHISWSLKQLAKQLGIPIIVLSQLSRQCDKENRRPRPDDLRDSGNIEQDADMVLMLHVQQDQRDEATKPVHIGVPANRCGPQCWIARHDGTTPFEFDGPTQTFREVA